MVVVKGQCVLHVPGCFHAPTKELYIRACSLIENVPAQKWRCRVSLSGTCQCGVICIQMSENREVNTSPSGKRAKSGYSFRCRQKHDHVPPIRSVNRCILSCAPRSRKNICPRLSLWSTTISPWECPVGQGPSSWRYRSWNIWCREYRINNPSLIQACSSISRSHSNLSTHLPGLMAFLRWVVWLNMSAIDGTKNNTVIGWACPVKTFLQSEPD